MHDIKWGNGLRWLLWWSVQVALPVTWHPSSWTRRRLVQRMVFGWRQRGSLEDLFGQVVPEPILAWFEAPDDAVTGGFGVLGGVLTR
jgi:hypothetical protein